MLENNGKKHRIRHDELSTWYKIVQDVQKVSHIVDFGAFLLPVPS
jgi:hypothetical protein